MATLNNENAAPRVSQLRPPSKISIPGQSLHEISEAEHNTRAMMPPPSTIGSLKHKPSGLPEPTAKRKGPPIPESERPAGSRSLHIDYGVNTDLVNSGSHIASYGSKNSGGLSRSSSHSSSATGSSRFPSAASRNISGASTAYSNSTGPGSRPISGSRPHSAMSSSKTSSGYNSYQQCQRTSTNLDNHQSTEAPSSVPGKRQGTKQIPIISHTPASENSSFVLRRQRQRSHRRREDTQSQKLLYTPTPMRVSHSAVSESHDNAFRISSVTAALGQMSLRSDSRESEANTTAITTSIPAEVSVQGASIPEEPVKVCPVTPSYIPKLKQQIKQQTPAQTSQPITPVAPSPCLSSPSKCPFTVKSSHGSLRKHPDPPRFLNRYTNDKAPDPAWDTAGRLEDMETMFLEVKQEMAASTVEKTNIQQQMDLHKTRINELESIRSQLSTSNKMLQSELESIKAKLQQAAIDLETSRRTQSLESDDMRRKYRNDIEDLRDEHRRELERCRREKQEEIDRLMKNSKDDVSSVEKRLNQELDTEKQKRMQEIEIEKERRAREVQEVNSQLAAQKQSAELDIENKDREISRLENELTQTRASVEQEKALNSSLRDKLTEAAATRATLEASIQALQAEKNFLKSDSQAQSQAFADLNQKTQEAVAAAADALEKLRKEETLRRKLHNQIQELKGNIRVFCRVRPTLEADGEEAAKISFPDADEDCKEVVVMGPEQQSALGKITTSKNPFSFDRVFCPTSSNSDIFEEISQLVQSALDGYNVCIFCYGQTGSGKTHTMSAEDGMIPAAVHQIYSTASSLQEKGWNYEMEGSFVEVYNENLNDLLGKSEDLDKKKLEIRHDVQTGRTTITDVNSVILDSPNMVATILKRATANRSVAATKANERSSRSHSVFILKLNGVNSVTGEKSEGTLNLVDLAGSERLAHSGATGERLKETQNINRSLSCLGDVIGALGQGKEGAHIPYRNSKLTYLLQNSLGGNSKTLMFVMISPLQTHLSETLTSLKFATKVHNTHIGSAKRLIKA